MGKGHEDDMQMYASLRAPADDRPINKRAQPYDYEMPDGPAAVERASRPCRYSFSTDANAAFNAFRIHEDSQKYFTIWLPDGDSPTDGASKYSMLRLGFGFRNSPAIMVEWQFGEEQKRDFDALRAALIDSTLNYAPDYAHELILSTDASDYAIGSRLFQHSWHRSA